MVQPPVQEVVDVSVGDDAPAAAPTPQPAFVTAPQPGDENQAKTLEEGLAFVKKSLSELDERRRGEINSVCACLFYRMRKPVSNEVFVCSLIPTSKPDRAREFLTRI